MEELSSVNEIDSVVTKNPNSIVMIYKTGCPWCEKLKKDLVKIEKSGKAKIYLLNSNIAGNLVKKFGNGGVPLTIGFKECDVNRIYEGYSDEITPTLMHDYENALPVCNVDLSKVLFNNTSLGEPIL